MHVVLLISHNEPEASWTGYLHVAACPLRSKEFLWSCAGYLCEPTPDEFAAALTRCTDEPTATKLGQRARQRVIDAFSRAKFGAQLERYLRDML